MLAVLALTSVTGCSLALSGPDPKRPRNRAPQCDTGKGPVTLDAVMGSILGTGALIAASDDEGGVALVTGLLAAAYLGAAIRGNSTVNDCREAIAAYEAPLPDPERERPSFAAQDDEPRRRPVVTPEPVYTRPRPGPTAPRADATGAVPRNDGPPSRDDGPPPSVGRDDAPPPAPRNDAAVRNDAAPRSDAPPAAPRDPRPTPKRRPDPPAKTEDAPPDWRSFWTEVP